MANSDMDLPPDPDNMNDLRSQWAGAAIAAFMQMTGCDGRDALSDLLADLLHWADRHQYDFAFALLRAQRHYETEIAEIG